MTWHVTKSRGSLSCRSLIRQQQMRLVSLLTLHLRHPLALLKQKSKLTFSCPCVIVLHPRCLPFLTQDTLPLETGYTKMRGGYGVQAPTDGSPSTHLSQTVHQLGMTTALMLSPQLIQIILVSMSRCTSLARQLRISAHGRQWIIQSMTHQSTMRRLADHRRRTGHVYSLGLTQPHLSLLTALINHLPRPVALAGPYLMIRGDLHPGQPQTAVTSLPGTHRLGLPPTALP